MDVLPTSNASAPPRTIGFWGTALFPINGMIGAGIFALPAVLAAGVILTRSTRVYDLVNETVLRSTEAGPLEIPAGAVVVPGSRAVDSDFGRANGLALSAPCIVKYRDASTDASTTLEDALR